MIKRKKAVAAVAASPADLVSSRSDLTLVRALLQRVARARVTVEDESVGEIGEGLCVFLGVGKGDDESTCEKLAAKIVGLRIFPDASQSMNRSLSDIGGQVLLVSQFTLYADCRKGRRPSFEPAESPERADALYRHFASCLAQLGHAPQEGRFGADMQVEIHNSGPVTIWLDSADMSRSRRS